MEVISPILPCNSLLKTEVKSKGRTPTGSRLAKFLLKMVLLATKGSMWVVHLI